MTTWCTRASEQLQSLDCSHNSCQGNEVLASVEHFASEINSSAAPSTFWNFTSTQVSSKATVTYQFRGRWSCSLLLNNNSTLCPISTLKVNITGDWYAKNIRAKAGAVLSPLVNRTATSQVNKRRQNATYNKGKQTPSLTYENSRVLPKTIGWTYLKRCSWVYKKIIDESSRFINKKKNPKRKIPTLL